MGSRDLNPGIHAYKARASPTELSAQQAAAFSTQNSEQSSRYHHAVMLRLCSQADVDEEPCPAAAH